VIWIPKDRDDVKRRQIGNLKKNPPIGREGVYDENSDFRGKKTNRMEKNIKYI
jgi:hypothetical protein